MDSDDENDNVYIYLEEGEAFFASDEIRDNNDNKWEEQHCGNWQGMSRSILYYKGSEQ